MLRETSRAVAHDKRDQQGERMHVASCAETLARCFMRMVFSATERPNAEITGAPPRAPGKRADADGASG